ncbi:MAG: ABC transporter ATP-binding protein [Actinomycetota bacterium]
MSGLIADIGVRIDDFALDVAVSVDVGETVALLGPNGAGKSTTVRSLTGAIALERGRIELAGRELDAPTTPTFVPPHERRIGVAFQDALLFPHLDVAGNVAFGLERRRRGEADMWLERVGLAGFGSRRVSELSGGEARRVAIARALASDPHLLILDEPFAGLDAGARVELRRLLASQLPDLELPILFITHDAAEARTLADHLVVLESGKVTQRGAPSDVQRRPTSRYIADLLGTNLLTGSADAGVVRLDTEDIRDVEGGALELTIADRTVAGPVRLTFAPHAVSLHGSQPGGSPRNVWQARVGDLHDLVGLVRVHLDAPVPIVVDVTPGAIADLAIQPGSTVWVAVKATAFDVVSGS